MILALLLISALFFLLLIIKEFLPGKIKENFCVICTAVSTTWLILLVLYKLKIYNDSIILAVLMGGSSVGLFYMLTSKFSILNLFRLPLLLTLFFLAYTIIVLNPETIKVIGLLIILWSLFFIFFFTRENRKIKKLIKKIIECCKNW